MLTNIDAKQKAEEIKAEYKKRYEKAVKHWRKGKEVDSDFLVRQKVTSAELYSTMKPKDVMEAIKTFEKEVFELPYHIDGEYEWELSASYDEIYDNYFEYGYYVLCDESYIITNLAKNTWKEWLKEQAKPKGYSSYVRTLNCKVVDMFMDGSINFETLQKLTYDGCKL